jgi:membrane-bound lytic murein transglycosylase A
MDDGSEVWIAFAGKNGRRFRGVGGILRKMGELEKGEGTMQGIRKWFEENPSRYHEIVDKNPAKVFFTKSKRAGAQGTQGVILVPRRSMAVDRAAIPLSAPVWVSTKVPVAGKKSRENFQQLVIAQDTGGAILGAVRGDIYFGDDAAAGDVAGRMSGGGRVWVLLPKAITP